MSLFHMVANLWIFAVAGFETLLSTVTKHNSKDKTFGLHFTQPLQIAAVVGSWPTPTFNQGHIVPTTNPETSPPI